MSKILTSIKQKVIDPLVEFFHDSKAIGIVLLLCTFTSLILANLPIGKSYFAFWNFEIPHFHDFNLPHSLLHFINDGFMALFFFLAGMEIKREMAEGELASLKKSALPVAGAIGGMICPAIIYILFNKGTAFTAGWAIPTATDIAFSLGVASLLGNKVPVSLKIFLTALAIIDDLGAIIVIALFYGEPVKVFFLIACIALILIIILTNKSTKKFGLPQFILGFFLWYCMFNSGIHATVAGVIFALLVPVPLLSRFENKLHNVVYFFVLPIFALANTAIIIPNNVFAALNTTLPWGIIFGLLIGKPLGIFLACYLLIKKKYADFPTGTNWNHMIGAGILAAIGFTMSIFISTLAFADAEVQDVAKISVLLASFIAMIAGYLWLLKTHKKEVAA